MTRNWQFVSLVTQRHIKVSTRNSNCSMSNASHLLFANPPLLMIPRMALFHPGIYNIVNAVWLKGRSRNEMKECVQDAR